MIASSVDIENLYKKYEDIVNNPKKYCNHHSLLNNISLKITGLRPIYKFPRLLELSVKYRENNPLINLKKFYPEKQEEKNLDNIINPVYKNENESQNSILIMVCRILNMMEI